MCCLIGIVYVLIKRYCPAKTTNNEEHIAIPLPPPPQQQQQQQENIEMDVYGNPV